MPLHTEQANRQTLAHCNAAFQLNIYKKGLPQPTSDTYSNCAAAFTYSSDAKISQRSSNIAQARLRLVRVDSNFSERLGIDEIDSQQQILIGHKIPKPRIFWNRQRLIKRPKLAGSQVLLKYYFTQMDWQKPLSKNKSEHPLNSEHITESLPSPPQITKAFGINIPGIVITDNPKRELTRRGVRTEKIAEKALGSHWDRETQDSFIGGFPQIMDTVHPHTTQTKTVPSLFHRFNTHDRAIRVYKAVNKTTSCNITEKQSAAQTRQKPDSVDIQPCFHPASNLEKIKKLQQKMKFD